MNARFEEIESRTTERISELETQLMQATKETELLKVSVVPGRARRLMRVISRAKCVVLITSNDKDGINLETNLARQLISTLKSPSSFLPTCNLPKELFLISLKIKIRFYYQPASF